ncbi:MAG TPA: FecR domain-containing protein [Caulobacteraceae bacterium]
MSAKPLDQRKSPAEIAAWWLNEHRSGEVTAEGARAFEAWMEADPANRAAYERLERVWGALGAAAEDPRVMAAREAHRRRFSTGVLLRWGAVAASVLALVAAAGTLPRGAVTGASAPAQQRPFANGAAEFQTSVGQRTTVTLPDKSVVTLDTDTIMRVHDKPGERLVTLEKGRAFFRVAKDPTRPFIVQSGSHRVRAIGTAFDVRVAPKAFEVTLIEGRVKVETRSLLRPAATTAQLSPGQRLEIEGARPELVKVDLKAETTWHDGRLTFARDQLTDAVAEMNRYSEKKIVFVGAPPQQQIVGVFRAGDVDSFARALTMKGFARVVAESEDRIELSTN